MGSFAKDRPAPSMGFLSRLSLAVYLNQLWFHCRCSFVGIQEPPYDMFIYHRMGRLTLFTVGTPPILSLCILRYI